jgi:erythrin-vacuolar iron transport family protein
MAHEGDTRVLNTERQEEQPVVKQEEQSTVKAVKKKTIRQEVADIFHAIGRNDASSHDFLLRVVQPGLAGLMDGSVSTLAPIFATAFASHEPGLAFLVGMASATGAGISMAFSEALSDDGVLTGRGSPVVRGAITGFMTFFGGSLHTLPFLISQIHVALTVAYVVVAFELVLIAAIRHRYFGTSWLLSMIQVVGGGALVFVAAMIFGNA